MRDSPLLLAAGFCRVRGTPSPGCHLAAETRTCSTGHGGSAVPVAGPQGLGRGPTALSWPAVSPLADCASRVLSDTIVLLVRRGPWPLCSPERRFSARHELWEDSNAIRGGRKQDPREAWVVSERSDSPRLVPQLSLGILGGFPKGLA